MSRTQGFLSRGIAQFRLYSDEPATNAKYSDSNIITMLESSYQYILGEVQRATTLGNTVVAPIQTYCDTLLLGSDVARYYALPSYIGKILRVMLLDASKNELQMLWARNTQHPWGKGFRIEENTFWVDAGALESGNYVRIEYEPSGCAALHEGTAEAVAATGLTVTLMATPTVGELDTHPNAYAGSRLRILSATTNSQVQERTILSYVTATRVATLAVALNPVPATSITYEICPITSQVMDRAIWLHAVLDTLAVEDSKSRYGLIKDRLAMTMRELRLFYGQRDLQAGGRLGMGGYRGV